MEDGNKAEEKKLADTHKATAAQVLRMLAPLFWVSDLMRKMREWKPCDWPTRVYVMRMGECQRYIFSILSRSTGG